MFDRDKAKAFLLKLADILDGLKVPFFLIQGTALGAWRDGDFTPTERDIDLGILIEHLRPKAGDICKALVDADVEVETWHRHEPFGFCHTIVAYTEGAKADLVGFHRFKGMRFAATPLCPEIVPEPYCLVHEAALLEYHQPVSLFGRTFNVPRPINVYLEREYGPDWRTPAEDHTSRTRVYDFLRSLPDEFFRAQP